MPRLFAATTDAWGVLWLRYICFAERGSRQLLLRYLGSRIVAGAGQGGGGQRTDEELYSAVLCGDVPAFREGSLAHTDSAQAYISMGQEACIFTELEALVKAARQRVEAAEPPLRQLSRLRLRSLLAPAVPDEDAAAEARRLRALRARLSTEKSKKEAARLAEQGPADTRPRGRPRKERPPHVPRPHGRPRLAAPEPQDAALPEAAPPYNPRTDPAWWARSHFQHSAETGRAAAAAPDLLALSLA